MIATHRVLGHILREPVPDEAIPDLAGWLDRLDRCPFTRTLERAVWAGFEADRLGYAFTGGYEGALARLLDDGDRPAVARRNIRRSLAATEAGGNHPRAIETRLTREGDSHVRIDGTKTFATLASIADDILVVGSEGIDPAGRPVLRIVRVPRGATGLGIEDREPVPFAPEIPHARLTFDGVRVAASAILPGDGYADYLKPFRTIEDTHVLGATLGYLVRIARAFAFAPALIEEAAALILSLEQIAAHDPRDAAVHVALGGAFRAARSRLDASESEWAKAPPEIAARWQRDRGLLFVAEGARTKRSEAAFLALGRG
jgi:acyl-CoA dehydrogenase